jgi:hypothetical protein
VRFPASSSSRGTNVTSAPARSSKPGARGCPANQLRVGLCDRTDQTDRRRKPRLGSLGLNGSAGGEGVGARTRYLAQRLALMGCVSVHGLDEIWHEVVPALELDLDPAPSLVDLVPGPHRAVAGDDGPRTGVASDASAM